MMKNEIIIIIIRMNESKKKKKHFVYEKCSCKMRYELLHADKSIILVHFHLVVCNVISVYVYNTLHEMAMSRVFFFFSLSLCIHSIHYHSIHIQHFDVIIQQHFRSLKLLKYSTIYMHILHSVMSLVNQNHINSCIHISVVLKCWNPKPLKWLRTKDWYNMIRRNDYYCGVPYNTWPYFHHCKWHE